MTTVGVRDLKNQRSRYLELVKGGESVLVTEHHRIIAQISLPQAEFLPSPLEERLSLMEQAGKIIRAKRDAGLAKASPCPSIDWEPLYQEARSDRLE